MTGPIDRAVGTSNRCMSGAYDATTGIKSALVDLSDTEIEEKRKSTGRTRNTVASVRVSWYKAAGILPWDGDKDSCDAVEEIAARRSKMIDL